MHQFNSGHAGQLIIGNQQINSLAARFEQCFLAGRGFENLQIGVIQRVQCGMQKTQNVALIVNEQNSIFHLRLQKPI